MFGLCDPVSKSAYQKRTLFWDLLQRLESCERRCDGSHLHQHVESSVVVNGQSVKRSVLAGHYPSQLCVAIASLVCSARGVAHSSQQRRRRTLENQ